MNPNSSQNPAPNTHGATPKAHSGRLPATPAASQPDLSKKSNAGYIKQNPYRENPGVTKTTAVGYASNTPAQHTHSATPTQPDKLIRIKTVCEMTGLGKTSVYSIPDFPKRVVLSRRAVGWRLSEVTRWIESRSPAGVTHTSAI